jgi:regulator of nucleoside diphosphate kinase
MEMTMSDKSTNRGKPKIVIGDVDHERLTSLATGALDRMPEMADVLLSELERAKVVKARSVPADVIQMGSTIEYRSDDGQQREVTLVFPGEADIAEGKVSILTPIGTALIGLSQGQSIDWTARDGRRHRLTILSVKQSATSES